MARSEVAPTRDETGVTASGRELPPLIRVSCPFQHVMPAWDIIRMKLEGIRRHGAQ